jgi:hypothetical protein
MSKWAGSSQRTDLRNPRPIETSAAGRHAYNPQLLARIDLLMKPVPFNLGRGLGALAGAVLSVLWAYAMWVPGAGLPSLAGISFAVALLMCFIAIIAVIASIHGHSGMLMVTFLASFLPVGAVLIQVELWFRWIGVLDLALFVAVGMIWVGARDRG